MASNYPQTPPTKGKQDRPLPRKTQITIFAALGVIILALCALIAILVLRKPAQAEDQAAEEKTTAAVRDDPVLNEMREGIAQLREGMPDYLQEVPEYEQGLVKVVDKKLQLTEGQLKLNQGYADYVAGKQQLDEGKKNLDDSEELYADALKQYNEGVKLIEENTDAYNEAKAKLAQLEPLMPYANAYINFRNGTVSSLPGFGQEVFYNAQAWYAQIVAPLAASLGVSLPNNVTDFPAAMQLHVSEAKAQMKEYEEGLAMLEAAKPQLEAARVQLDQGYVTYNDGQAALANGAEKLREGEAQLAQSKQDLADAEEELMADLNALTMFEDQEDLLAAGVLNLMQKPEVAELLGQKAYFGSDYDSEDPESLLWQKDKNGNFIIVNGHKVIDLDACETVVDAAQQYANSYEGKGSPWDD